MKKAILITLLAMIVMPLVGLAADDKPLALFTDLFGACQMLHNIINILFSIIMIVAVIYILIAAFNYLTSGGSTEKVETATTMIKNAIIAVVIAVLAWTIPMVIVSFMFRASPNASGQDSGSYFSCEKLK